MTDICLHGLYQCLVRSSIWGPPGCGADSERTYISPFSNRFFKFSLMASFDTLLMRVRSDTPTSFFFVVSNVAFLMLGLLLPDAPARPPDCALPAALSPFGRRLIP
jgi:hypothetical protein